MIALCGELTQIKFLFTKSSQPADAFSLLSHWMHHFFDTFMVYCIFSFCVTKEKENHKGL